MSEVLAYVGAGLVGGWGGARAIPPSRGVGGFEPITTDNRRVLVQEWLAEAFTMWGLAAIVIVSTAIGDPGSAVGSWVYRAVAGLLIALAVLTGLTGARTPVIWFKVCPVLLSTSAVLLLVASI